MGFESTSLHTIDVRSYQLDDLLLCDSNANPTEGSLESNQLLEAFCPQPAIGFSKEPGEDSNLISHLLELCAPG